MKKSFIAIAMALTFGFVWAVALCVRALGGVQSVSAFDGEKMCIVIDAGHGGIDGGVVGRKTGVKESELNLAISFYIRDELESAGFEVVLTRKTDAGLYGTTAKGFKKRDMQQRKEIILEANPALVISVHQNFYASQTQRGGQVFFGTDNEKSRLLAGCIQGKLNSLYAEKEVKNRTISSGDFFILHCAPCPSVIVECGFLSNAQDEGLLLSKAWQKRLANSVVAGIIGYLADGAA